MKQWMKEIKYFLVERFIGTARWYQIECEQPHRNPDNFEIKCKMVNPNVAVMDMESFRKSKVVKEQCEAALRIVERQNK